VARPAFRTLGPRFGKATQQAAAAIRALPQEALAAYAAGGSVDFELEGRRQPLREGDLEVVQEASGDLVVKGEGGFTVALDPTLDDELRTEGIARELVNRIQRLRKDAGLEITDRIELALGGPNGVHEAAEAFRDFIAGETLAVSLSLGAAELAEGYPHVRDVDLDGTPARIALRPASA
jgi:isoleucyl-tRNA synthetase